MNYIIVMKIGSYKKKKEKEKEGQKARIAGFINEIR
jgi:hypothetical protein